jgi:hypothetical protein
MRTETRTVQIGERVGDIDWNYNFLSHFVNYCTSDEKKAEFCKESMEQLRVIEERFKAGLPTLATTYGGWPRCGFGEVLDVGMYDGWPYWRPVPSICIKDNVLGGGNWHAFSTITEIRAEDK